MDEIGAPVFFLFNFLESLFFLNIIEDFSGFCEIILSRNVNFIFSVFSYILSPSPWQAGFILDIS